MKWIDQARGITCGDWSTARDFMIDVAAALDKLDPRDQTATETEPTGEDE